MKEAVLSTKKRRKHCNHFTVIVISGQALGLVLLGSWPPIQEYSTTSHSSHSIKETTQSKVVVKIRNAVKIDRSPHE